MKAKFIIPFQRGPVTYYNSEGIDQIISWGRLEAVPDIDPETSLVQIEASEEVMADIKANSGWVWVEDVVEDV